MVHKSNLTSFISKILIYILKIHCVEIDLYNTRQIVLLLITIMSSNATLLLDKDKNYSPGFCLRFATIYN